MVRQYEAAKLDEAKEGQALQPVDVALPPDHKSRPSLAVFTLVGAVLGLFASAAWVLARRFALESAARDPQQAQARAELWRAWRWRG
jgi:uncharacterized protein involved in exopolysaccharide biosynthesis